MPHAMINSCVFRCRPIKCSFINASLVLPINRQVLVSSQLCSIHQSSPLFLDGSKKQQQSTSNPIRNAATIITINNENSKELTPTKQYESRIISYLNFNKYDHAIQTFREAVEHQVIISSKTYVILFEKLKPHVKRFSTDVTFILRHLLQNDTKKHQFNYTDRFYRAVLRICGETGNIEGAKYWFQSLEKHKTLKVDKNCVNSLMHAYSKHCMFDEAFKLISTMRSKYQQEPDIFSFSILMNCCKTIVQMKTAAMLMKRFNVLPNAVWNTSVIRVLCENGKREEALKLYQDMKQSPYQDQQPTSDTIYHLVQAYSNPDSRSQLESFMKDMEELNIKPNRALVYSLVQHSEQFREDLIKKLIVESIDVIEQLHTDYPELFSTLLTMMKQLGDGRLNKVRGWLIDMRILREQQQQQQQRKTTSNKKVM